MTKRTGLGTDPLRWIAPTTDLDRPVIKRHRPAPATPVPRPAGPKFKSFEVRLTVLLRDDQLAFLEEMVRTIRKSRAPEFRKERITKNTLIRVFIDAFRSAQMDCSNIPDEEALLARAKHLLRT